MNICYALFILIILSNIKIIIPLYDEFSQLNFNSNFDEDNNNEHALKSNKKIYFGFHLSEFLFSQSRTKEGSSKDADELYDIFRNELTNILNNTKNITPACHNHLCNKLIGNDESEHNFQNYHIKKLINDSSKHRNNLGTYDRSMH